MNGDGNRDIVAAYAAGPRVWLGDGKGSWREASQGLPAPEIHGLYWGIDVADLNGDGRIDLVVGLADAAAAGGVRRTGRADLRRRRGRGVSAATRRHMGSSPTMAFCR